MATRTSDKTKSADAPKKSGRGRAKAAETPIKTKTKAVAAKVPASKAPASKAAASKAAAPAKAKRAARAPKLHIHIEHGPTNPPSQDVTPALLRAAAKSHPGILDKVKITIGRDQSKLDEALKDAEVLMTASFVDISNLAERAPGVKWLQSMSAGVERYVPLVPESVTLTNASGVHTPRGGEYGITAVLMLNSRVPQFVTHQQAQRWEQIYTTPLAGKTLVLAGVGAIGGEVARLAKRFGMTVLGVTRSGQPHRWVDKMFTTKQLAKALPKADFLLATLPLTPETRGLIGRAELDLLPPHAGVANLGRGAVMDYDALADKLRQGELSGAVLDVFHQEPLPADSPLWSVPNLIISPHCAVDDEESYVSRALDIFFDNVERYIAGKKLRNVVDTKLGY